MNREPNNEPQKVKYVYLNDINWVVEVVIFRYFSDMSIF